MAGHVQRNVMIVGAVAFFALMIIVLSGDDPIEVHVHSVEQGTVEWTVANTRAGTVEACRRSHLSPPIGGQISQLNIQKGDAVKPGQILLELWNDDLKARVALAQREARVAKETSHEACLLADVADRDAQRLLRLSKDKLASEEDVDRAVTNAKAKRAGCKAGKARAEVAKAQVDVAQASLARTQLKAPFAGWVAEINGELGEFVTPSPQGIQTPPAVDIVDTSCLYISAPIDEVDAPHIQLGMVARISLDAFSDQPFLGAVRRIAPYVLEVEKQARTVEVEAVFMDEEQYKDLMPGYSADLEIILNSRDEALRVPTEAILEGGRVYVLVDDVIEERAIEKGLSNWQYTQILSGLDLDEMVILSVDKEGVEPGAEAVAEVISEDD